MLCIHMYVSVIKGFKKNPQKILHKNKQPIHPTLQIKSKTHQTKIKTKQKKQAGFNKQMLIAYKASK